MDTSQNFNILEVDTLRTNKLDYYYNNNVIFITKNNCKNINLNSSYSDYYIITKDNDLDINITLSSITIGTKYRILITNKQKSLTITCKRIMDGFKGTYILNNNSNIINNDTLENNLKKKMIRKTITEDETNNKIFIPDSKLGLFNGGYIDLLYIGNNGIYLDDTVSDFNEINGYWLVNANLIGEIKTPLSIETNTNTNSNLSLNMYVEQKTSTYNLINVTTKNNITNNFYFNNVYNNHILIYKNLYYDYKIIDVSDNTLLYPVEPLTLGIGSFIGINTSYNNLIDFDIVNLGVSSYINLNNENVTNVYRFTNDNTQDNPKFEGILNIIDIEKYSDSSNNIFFPSLLFDNYNIITDKNNNNNF